MAHLILKVSELEQFKQVVLPNDTTIVVENDDFYTLYTYRIENGKFVLVKDFIEYSRGWNSDEEKNEFESKLTKENIIDFFINYDENIPKREYRSICNKEFEYFKYLRHRGSYLFLENKRFNLFRLSLNQNDELNEAKKEIEIYLLKVKEYIQDLDSIEIKIFEHTLSENGSYSLICKENEFIITCIYYNTLDKIKSFTSLDLALQYIQQHHWYE